MPDRDRTGTGPGHRGGGAGAGVGTFGEVLGAVGYHYDLWALVGAGAEGIGVRTRTNPDLPMLDDFTWPRRGACA